jgi:hypothetical protein
MSKSRGTSVASILKMRSLGTLGFLAALSFYVAWPLYAGYDINSSLDTHNVESLNARVDFPSVRVSLKPAVTEQVEKVITEALRKAGGTGGAFGEQLKDKVTPSIVEAVLNTFVTPEMLIRIHESGKTLKEALGSIVVERASQQGLGGMMIVPTDQSDGARSQVEEIASKLGIDTSKVFGGAVQKEAAPLATAPVADILPAKSGPKPKYGIGNIKHFTFNGPLGLSVGVARNASAKKPELVADLTFVDGTWKITGLTPEL